MNSLLKRMLTTKFTVLFIISFESIFLLAKAQHISTIKTCIEESNNNTSIPDEYSTILFALSLLAGLLFWIPYLSFIGKSFLNPKSRFIEIIHEHFAATIGLPLAAIGSFFTVLVFKTTLGPMNFTIAGLTFEGSSGPITLWILCLLACSFSLKLLWPLGIKSQKETESENIDNHPDQ